MLMYLLSLTSSGCESFKESLIGSVDATPFIRVWQRSLSQCSNCSRAGSPRDHERRESAVPQLPNRNKPEPKKGWDVAMDRRRHKECLNGVKIALSAGPRTAEIG